ncbi:MAG: hypothetical protein IJW46_05505 [Clostridia bacterium]|nr:hypothetical protein [Clostridia bacterium]
MNPRDILFALNEIDFDLVESAEKTPARSGRRWRRFLPLAASFLLFTVIGIFLIAPLIASLSGNPVVSVALTNPPSPAVTSLGSAGLPSSSGNDTPLTQPVVTTDSKVEGPLPALPPQAPSISGGNSLSGALQMTSGAPIEYGIASTIAPGFHAQTVVEAEVIEILDSLYTTHASGTPYYVAKLRILSSLRGDRIPEEIYFRFRASYSKDVFAGCDSLILSLAQIGVENYLLLDLTEQKSAYFPHMFCVSTVDELGYGSVIAFTDGKVNADFFDRVDITEGEITLTTLTENPEGSGYPASRTDTVEKVKERLAVLFTQDAPLYEGARELTHDYIERDTLFAFDAAKTALSAVSPSDNTTFAHELSLNPVGATLTYTRLINGFPTEEIITLDSTEQTVSHPQTRYDTTDLAEVPNLSAVLEQLTIEALTPPHTTVPYTKGYFSVSGCYRKAGDTVYGIIRMHWTLRAVDSDYQGVLFDDAYYLYTAGTSDGMSLDREEIRHLFSETLHFPFTQYNQVYAIMK